MASGKSETVGVRFPYDVLSRLDAVAAAKQARDPFGSYDRSSVVRGIVGPGLAALEAELGIAPSSAAQAPAASPPGPAPPAVALPAAPAPPAAVSAASAAHASPAPPAVRVARRTGAKRGSKGKAR